MSDAFANIDFGASEHSDASTINSIPAVAANENSAAKNPKDPFSNLDFSAPEETVSSSATGSFSREFARGVVPGMGALAGAGAGAKLGVIAGALVPFVGETGISEGIGGLVGGGIGAMVGGMATSKAQDYAIEKMPESAQETLGLDKQQRMLDQTLHPDAAFLGGITPMALTMRPGAIASKVLPDTATNFQKLLNNPYTARAFGGAVMGGMELGNEKVFDGEINWRHVAIATGMGLIFNKPNALGERILGEHSSSPTLAQAQDMKVMGPGITEQVFQGEHTQAPEAEMAAHSQASAEQAAMGATQEPDLHAAARQIAPETFQKYDDLSAQRDTFRKWIDEQNNPPDQRISELTGIRDNLAAKLKAHTEQQASVSAPDVEAANQETDPVLRQKIDNAKAEGLNISNEQRPQELTAQNDPLQQPGEWRQTKLNGVDENGNHYEVEAGPVVDGLNKRVERIKSLMDCLGA